MKKKILLRFDDVCPTMNWSLFNWALDRLKEKNVTALLGVIPTNQDPDLNIEQASADFWDRMKELEREGFALAMHGYKHVFDSNCRGTTNRGYKSEFAGHPYEVQYDKIKKGKEILESHGIYVDTFFAPAHSYDNNTLKALAANGFKYLSDGKSCRPYIKYGLKCLPCRSYGIPRNVSRRYDVAVIHTHEWAWENRQEDVRRFKNLMELYSEKIATFDDFKKDKAGWLPFQLLTEMIYVWYERHMKSWMYVIYKIIKR